VVHARSTAVWLDAVLATLGNQRTKLLLGFHGQTQPGATSRRRRWLNRWCARRADGVLAVSDEAARMMLEQWGAPRSKLWSIPNGVDTDQFHPAGAADSMVRARDAVGLSPAELVVICVANLYPIKRLDVLLRAWRQVVMACPRVRLVIAGDGPLRGDLTSLTHELRCAATVKWLGRRDDVADLLRAADLFVLPSRYEACSNAVQEAMASGLPIVTTDVGGMRELITPQRTGWLVPPDAPKPLAETMLAALLDPAARRRVGQAARAAAVEQFGLDRWVVRLATLYSHLADACEPDDAAMMGEPACAG
jgi:glycosyltransferase involved in cell wall biosynthesis